MLGGEELEFELVGVEMAHLRISVKFGLKIVDMGFGIW